MNRKRLNMRKDEAPLELSGGGFLCFFMGDEGMGTAVLCYTFLINYQFSRTGFF